LRLPAEGAVGHEEGDGGGDAAEEGAARAHHRVLDRVGDEEDEGEVERGELADLALPQEAEDREDEEVDDQGAEDDDRELGGARPQLRDDGGPVRVARHGLASDPVVQTIHEAASPAR
jgi:hypothetical protein